MIVVEQRRFKNHFHNGAQFVAGIDHGADIAPHGFVISTFHFTDIDDHIDFLSPCPDGKFCFGNLGRGRVCSQWKPDDGTDLDD